MNVSYLDQTVGARRCSHSLGIWDEHLKTKWGPNQKKKSSEKGRIGFVAGIATIVRFVSHGRSTPF